MSDFTSGFWNIFVMAVTLASIVGCALLLVAMSRVRKKGQTPASPETTVAKTTETTGHVWDGDLAEYNNPLPKWWLNLFWITIVFSVVYLLLYPGFGNFPGLFGWTSSEAYAKERSALDATTQQLFDKYQKVDVKTLAFDPDARALGERLFLNYCAQCHGSSAQGGKGFPNLTDNDWLYGGDPETIKATITGGRMGVMPALGAALGPEGVREVAAYVRSLSGLPHDSLRAHLGKPRFAQTCAACHGADGKGNQAVGAPNLTDDVWLYGSSEATIIEGVNRGRHLDASEGSLAMPSFKDTLGEGKIHVLAAYVWGLSNKPATSK
jgi:cytochrome c oxidase cbb3-type subunit 3